MVMRHLTNWCSSMIDDLDERGYPALGHDLVFLSSAPFLEHYPVSPRYATLVNSVFPKAVFEGLPLEDLPRDCSN